MPKVSVEHEQMRRQQILAAAFACFSRRGYHATSMEDIVREAGLSVGAIYSYFPSKEDLFRVLAETRFEQTTDRLRAMVGRGGTLAERLDRALDYFFSALDDEIGPWMRLLLEVRGQHGAADALSTREQQRCRDLRGWFESLLRDGVAGGECAPGLDSGALADLFLALGDGVILHWVSGTLDTDRARLKRAMKTLVTCGILSRPSRALAEAPAATTPGPPPAALTAGSFEVNA